MTNNTNTTAASGAASLGPLNDRAIVDAIRSAYDLGYRDGAHGGASAVHQVERDHGGALIHTLARRLAAPAAQEAELAPIDMVLHCPACGLQHIDAPEPDLGPSVDGSGDMPLWSNPSHRSHLCHGCGHVWRPADVPTNGVAAVKTKGKADSPIAARAPRPQADAGAVPRITDPAIAEWAERHDLDRVLRGSHARAAVEDAQTLHLVPGAAAPAAESAPAVPEGWTDGLRAIDSFAAHIRRTLDSADYTAKTVPGLKDGPLYGACERAIFIQNKVRDMLAAAPQAPAAPTAGLPTAQEPKYTVSGGHIVNRASGEPVPHEEPVFVFRARDALGVRALEAYLSLIAEREPASQHADAVRARIADFQRFATEHPKRMKWPDTAAPTAAAASDEDEALDLLDALFAAWEDGTPCYDEPDSAGSFLGNAFRLDDATFHRCVDLLERRRSRQISATPAPAAGAAPTDARINPWRNAVLDLIDDCPGLSMEQDRWLSRRVKELDFPSAVAPAAAPAQEAAPLTYAELLEIRRAVDEFEDCGETDVDYRLLLRAALAGYLECTRFRPLNQSLLDLETAIEAARVRQEGQA